MRENDLIKKVKVKKGETLIDLENIYPIKNVVGTNNYQLYLNDNLVTHNNYANKVLINSKIETEIFIYLAKGYYAKKEPKWDDLFLNHSGWSGGDGIFSFNLENGADSFDLNKSYQTLFIFGDTFVGRSNLLNNHRLKPHLMVNNSLAYYKDHQIDFKLNELDDGSIKAFYHMDDNLDLEGTIPHQLIDEMPKEVLGYVSGYNPKDLYLLFDFHKEREFSHLNIFNYFNEEDLNLNKRGFKEIEILYSNDNKDYKSYKKHTLKISNNLNEFEEIPLKIKTRYLKFKVLSNYNDKDFNEGLYALNKVAFYHNDKHYLDINITSNSNLLSEKDNSWIWLQDGAVIGDTLIFYPFIVNNDKTQPEGLQFRIKGVSLFETKIKDNKLDLTTIKQKRAPLLQKDGVTEWWFGGGVFPNTKEANALNPDEYIYVYGNKTAFGARDLVLGRVHKDNYKYFDDYEYYHNGKWVSNMKDATTLLPHISTEFSVSEIRSGKNKGKYIAVFTYDVNTAQVAFSIGDNLWGPFSKPQIIYLCPEPEIYQSTTYSYNAKAHPHLSKSDEILISYNTNTYSWEHNMSDYRVYKPRFISLVEIKEAL